MPMKVTSRAGVPDYGNPFVGPVNHTVPIAVLISGLTTAEVDARGYLKPGVPLTIGGGLAAALTRSTLAAAVADGGNTGAATVGSLVGGYGAPAETITITALTTGATGTFRVEGSVSGFIGTGAVGTAFSSPILSFLITDGTPDLTAGDIYTIAVTPGGTMDRVYGCVVEATKVAASNSSDDRTAAGTVAVVVAVAGMVNRDILEDNLERSLTAAEIAGFAGSNLTLTTT